MKSFKQFNEVAPPGFGHTKGDKEKGVKKGGTAAAFDRARKRGDFKGSKSDMFAIMWSQHNKGDKPHYKPGTDKKYKKYQDESVGFEIDSGEHRKASKKAKIRNLAKGNTNPNEKAAAEKKAGGPKLIGEEECKCEDCGQDPCIECGESHHNIEEGISTSDTKRLEKATVLSFSNDPKSVDRARARQVEVDYKDLMKQQNKKRKKKSVKEALVSRYTKNWPAYTIDPSSKKERLAADLIDLEKQDKRAAWTAAQLRAKKKKMKEDYVIEKDLSAAERRALPDKDFVFPGKGEGPEGKQRGAYPINDKKHARAALAMAAAHASPEKEAKVKAAVKKKFPDIQQEAIDRQAKDRKKLSQPHSVSGSRRDHSHDVDSALTDHVPRKGKGRMRPASKKEMRVSAMRDAGIREEKKSCPEGEYYCFDMGKCRPIPEGHKVRKDGELVKEEVYRGKGVGRKVDLKDKDTDRVKARKTAVKSVARGIGKVAGGAVKKLRSERDAVVGVGKSIKKKGKQFKTGLTDRIRKGVKSGARAVGKVGAEVKKGYEAGLKSEATDLTLQKEKRKAINSIPDKNREQYNRNWQHKTPDNPRESVELLGADGKVAHEIVDIIKPEPMKVPDSPVKWKELTEKIKLPAVNGSIICVYLTWRGRAISIKLFFPQSRTRRPTREEVNSQIQKIYPGAKIGNFVESDPEPGEPFLQVGD